MRNFILLLLGISIIPICISCLQHHPAVSRSLIERLKDLPEQELMSKDTHGRSYLHIAAIDDDTSSINYLVQKKVEIDSVIELIIYPLHIAYLYKNEKFIELLRSAGARDTRKSTGMPCHLHTPGIQ